MIKGKVWQKIRLRQSNWRVPTLVGLAALGLGICLVLLLSPGPTSQWATVPAVDTVVTVGTEEYLDEQKLSVSVEVVEEWTAIAATTGVVRGSSCKPGEQISSGQQMYTIDQAPVVALNLKRPLYRDLTLDDKGEDVLDLQTELSRLGIFRYRPDGTYGKMTQKAVASLWKSLGQKETQEDFPVSQSLWIPAQAVTPLKCFKAVGDILGAGDELFQIGGGISAVKVSVPKEPGNTEADIVEPGNKETSNNESGKNESGKNERVAYIEKTTTSLPEDGVITDPEFISAFVASTQYQAYVKDPATELQVATRLAQPLVASVVPASSLYEVSADSACVLSEGSAVPVRIVASQLGMTMILPDKPISTVSTSAAQDAPSCK